MTEFFRSKDVTSLVTSLGGRSATYTPHGGSPVPVTVLFEPGGEEKDIETGEVFLASDAVVFQRSEVSAPQRDASLVFDDADLPGTYLLGKTAEKDGATVVMEVRKDA